MGFLTWGRNPWGQWVITHVSWDLLWASAIGGILFLVAHASYMVFSRHTKADEAEVKRLEAASPNLPDKVPRHSFAARMFHWVMAASMFALLFTAFLPIVGVKFAWVEWHWIAGLVLTVSIIYHIIHATFWLDFWSIWVGPKDIPEFKAEMMRELGQESIAFRPGKYPLGNRLYHLAIVVAALSVVATGIFMMNRVRTPIFTRNPYILGDVTWGFTYLLHGLAGVGLVGLVIAHVYFALRPEKFWITKSMIFGWITRRDYLLHHDPQRWSVSGANTAAPRPAEGRNA